MIYAVSALNVYLGSTEIMM